MESGYVLDFSNQEFSRLIKDAVGLNIYGNKYEYIGNSKAKRLRAFWALETDFIVGKVLSEMLEVWKFEENIYNLINMCEKILSDNPLFVLINSYTTGISSVVLENILKTTVLSKYKGKVDAGELGLPITNNNLVLPCGIYGRFESD